MQLSDKLRFKIQQGKPISSYFKDCQMQVFDLSGNSLVSGYMHLGLSGDSLFMQGSWERTIAETGVADYFMLVSDKDKNVFIKGLMGTGETLIGFIPRILSNFLGAEYREEKRPDICMSSTYFQTGVIFNLDFFSIGLK